MPVTEAEVAQTSVVEYSHSDDLAGLLAQVGATLLVSTYQAGKIVSIGANNSELAIEFHNFDRPMGVAVEAGQQRLAIAGRECVWILQNERQIGKQLNPPKSLRDCFLTRSSHVTGPIQAHEVAWIDGELWVVNTLFSCLCTLDDRHSFRPRWKPPFISQLVAEDRCHLNGFAVSGNKVDCVTAMSATDHAGGWRETKATTGRIIDVDSGEDIATGFAMPHSPRVHAGELFVLDSGRGALCHVDRNSGKSEIVARFPGYTRGMTLLGKYAFIGLSKIRETSTFDGVPIAEKRERLKSGVVVLDLQSGSLVGQFEFTSRVDEIFDVSLISGATNVAIRGPHATEEGSPPVWVVPGEPKI